MRVAITGAAGLFGHGLTQVFQERHTTFPLTRADADITRANEVETVFSRIRPEVVIHPAGIPNIDLCEEDPAQAFLVNVHGARHVAEAARRVNARVVLISTDAVFDGLKQSPYTESDPTRPPTVYGRTKLRAERIVQSAPESWVFRVSVLFGPGKTNFIEKGLRKLAAGETYTVASDQEGSATYTLDAARKICEVIEAKRYGLYHLSNSVPCNRLELAQHAAKMAGLDPAKVIGKPSAEMGRRAMRLKYSVMEMVALKQAGFSLPRPWKEALKEYIAGLGFLRGRASSV